jgi:hypothetical protein
VQDQIRRREVTPFTHIRVEVEELDAFVPLIVVMLDKFPFAVAHGCGRTASLVRVVRQMPVEHARCGRRAGSKQLRLAHAVKFACRRCRPGELEERWKPVAVNERGLDDSLTGQARPSCDQRNAQPSFVEITLAGSKWRVVSDARVRPFRYMEAAVVAGEDDNRAIAQASSVEMREQASDRVVERLIVAA